MSVGTCAYLNIKAWPIDRKCLVNKENSKEIVIDNNLHVRNMFWA